MNRDIMYLFLLNYWTYCTGGFLSPECTAEEETSFVVKFSWNWVCWIFRKSWICCRILEISNNFQGGTYISWDGMASFNVRIFYTCMSQWSCLCVSVVSLSMSACALWYLPLLVREWPTNLYIVCFFLRNVPRHAGEQRAAMPGTSTGQRLTSISLST